MGEKGGLLSRRRFKTRRRLSSGDSVSITYEIKVPAEKEDDEKNGKEWNNH